MSISVRETAQAERLSHLRPQPLAQLASDPRAAHDIASLDGLRGVAVLLTVGFHLLTHLLRSPNISASTHVLIGSTYKAWGFGATGVQLFFVLSGFLLFRPYARALLSQQAFPHTQRFYTRRALRILPAYWASLVLLLLAQPQFLQANQWANVLSHIFLVHNWNVTSYTAINTPYWTLAVESQFYLVLPGVAWLIWKWMRTNAEHSRRRRWGVAIMFGLLIAISPAFTFIAAMFLKPNFPAVVPYLSAFEVIAYLCIFATGMVCSLLYVAVTESNAVGLPTLLVRRLCKIAGVAGIAILCGYILYSVLGPPAGWLSWVFEYLVLGLGYGGILLGTVLGWDSWQRMLSWPALRFVGLISYSLYIWNWPLYERVVVPFASSFGSDRVALILGIILTALVIIPFAFVFYFIFERPFIHARQATR
jgi:peptidoglycan/LPS O-acetylase OafA/YrhL